MVTPTNISPANSKRLVCQQCLRPEVTCICQWVKPLATETTVTIIQHPHEEKHHKGTGRLLHLCLRSSQLAVTDKFSDSLLLKHKTPVLLYPSSKDSCQLPAKHINPKQLQLIVLDGTWRKSRKLLYTSPTLQGLPRLSVESMSFGSRYTIRRAENDQQLSTFEAVTQALEILETNASLKEQLMSSFDGFIRQNQQQIDQFTLK